MDNFNFNLFKYFYYVVHYQGVTNASKNLSVAQPSLSLSIKNLENQLNKTLIDRNSKYFKLTEEGYQLFETLKPFFENIEKNIDFLPDEKKYLEINIGIRYSYGKPILLEFIKIFRQQYPKVKINVDLYSKLDFNKIESKEYDIVIDDDSYIEQLKSVTKEVLCEVDNCFICGATLFEEYQSIKSIRELDNVPFVFYRPSRKAGKFKQFCYYHNVSFLELFNINESELYFNIVKDNVCLGFSNKLLIKEYLDNKFLHIINVEEELFKDKLSIAYTKNDQIILRFIQMLKDFTMKELK